MPVRSLLAATPRRRVRVDPAPRTPAPNLGIARSHICRRAAIGRPDGRIDRPLRRKKVAEENAEEPAAIGGRRIVVVAGVIATRSARVIAVRPALVHLAITRVAVVTLRDHLLARDQKILR